MGLISKLNPFRPLLRWTMNVAISLLTKPIARYTVAIPNDMAQLRSALQKCDVILVEGNERISECIKYLTQSSWSHSVLYVGDEPMKRNPKQRAEFIEKYGEDADFLVVE